MFRIHFKTFLHHSISFPLPCVILDVFAPSLHLSIVCRLRRLLSQVSTAVPRLWKVRVYLWREVKYDRALL